MHWECWALRSWFKGIEAQVLSTGMGRPSTVIVVMESMTWVASAKLNGSKPLN